MEEELDLETKCKNCNHAIGLHTPRCSKVHYELSRKHICGLKDLNTTGLLYLIPESVGQNFIVMNVEALLVF
jgi:hypothetical protein